MLLFPKFIANNFLFKWSVSPTRDCCLDTRGVLFIYLWFQGDDESLIDSQTIITGQILDNNTQRLTIENILVARAGQAAACWLSDLVARGLLGWAGHYEAKIVNQARGEGSLMWDMSEQWSEAGAKLLFQWVRPSGRKTSKKSELIPVAGSGARQGPTYLSRNVERIYFQNSDQRVATSLHGGELQKMYGVNLKVQCNGFAKYCEYFVL